MAIQSDIDKTLAGEAASCEEDRAKKKLYLIGSVHTDPDGYKRLDTLFRKVSPKIIGLELSKDRMDEFYKDENLQEKVTQKMLEKLEENGLTLSNQQKELYTSLSDIISSYLGFEFRAAGAYCDPSNDCRKECMDITAYNNGKDYFIDGFVELESKEICKDENSKQELIKSLEMGTDNLIENLRLNAEEDYMNGQIIQLCYSLTRKKLIVDSQELNQKMDKANTLLIKYMKRDTSPPEGLSKVGEDAFNTIFSKKRDREMSRNIRNLYSGLREGNMVAVFGLRHLLPIRVELEDLNPMPVILNEYNSFI